MSSEETKPTEPTVEPTEPTETPTEVTEPTTEATEPTEETTEPTVEPTEPPIDIDNIEDSLKEKGFDYAELQKEYDENGDITKETREKLNAIGLTDEFIDDFIAGKKAQYEQQMQAATEELAKSIGGKEQFDTVIKWAADNLTKEEIEELNSIKGMTAAKMVLQGLKARMEEKEGVLPTFVQGKGQAADVDYFKSQAEMFAAIRDPRYNSDPAYQEQVTEKIRAARKAGINLGV